MKTQSFSTALLLALSAVLPIRAQEKPQPVPPKPPEPAKAAPAKPGKITSAEWTKKLKFDQAPLPPGGAAVTSYADMLAKATPAVVTIFSKREGNAELPDFFNEPFFKRLFPDGLPEGQMPETQPVTGSGVIVSPDGYILTNNHVVEESKGLRVELQGESRSFEATLVVSDPKSDVALIKIDGTNLPVIPVGDSNRLRVGDVMFAIGNPFGLAQTVTMGIVSALGRSATDVQIVDYANFIQTDAAINRGNSGGALIDAAGRLVGINTAIQGGAGGGNVGIGFAIPSMMAIEMVEKLLEGDGKVRRGFLGVSLQPLEPDLAEALGWKENYGVAISHVYPNTPASKAGLKPSDIILKYNGARAENPDKLRLVISNTRPSEEVSFEIFRAGDVRTIKLSLAELPDDPREFLGGAPGAPGAPGTPMKFLEGVEIAELDSASREKFRLPDDVAGVVVESVKGDSVAADAGLEAGMVIVEVNQVPVATVAEALKARKDFTGTVLLLRVSDGENRSILAIRVK
ncbi:MAG: Do family serine endopeptidase [Verrucomicrobia bacterium]|nr:Do family serine endopeptidase [Verrucomicrobiota bacterium]